MDDLMEQVFSLASWAEMGGVSRAPWGINGGSLRTAGNVDTGSGSSGPQKSFKMSLLQSGVLGSASASQGLSCQARDVQDNRHHPAEGTMQHPYEDQLMAGIHSNQRGLQDSITIPTTTTADYPHIEASSRTLSQGSLDEVQNPSRGMPQNMASTGLVSLQHNPGRGMVANSSVSPALSIAAGSSRGLARSPTVSGSGSEGSSSHQIPPDGQAAAPTWYQPYIGGVSPLPIGAVQAKAETCFQREVLSNDTDLLGKRPQDDNDARAGLEDGSYTSFEGTQVGQVQTAILASHHSFREMEAGEGVSLPAYRHHTGLGQSQGAGAVVAGTARPRVRARRGQATDPHSIAERLRRERISERMKALQELVPNSNKTDKASMLDEIIDYVKFLQLQVKVLSMSRLGGAGAVTPRVTELPSEGLGRSSGASNCSEDGLAVAEHEVARLLEDDMGSAMKYLQGKGLCLMPVSLATTISCSNLRLQINNQGSVQNLIHSANPLQLDVSGSTPAASNITSVESEAVVSPTNSVGDGVGSDCPTNRGSRGAHNLRESI